MNGMKICEFLWIAFFVIWVIWGLRTKATQQRENVSSRLSYIALPIVAYFLMFTKNVSYPWLLTRILPANLWVVALGVIINVVGLMFAIWARAYLGGNWSSAVTVKVGHELVRTGPYRRVRHPIYTGMVSATLGTAVVRGEVRGIIAVVLLYYGFHIKSRIVEQTMTRTFGAAYEDYSRKTGAIVPRWPS